MTTKFFQPPQPVAAIGIIAAAIAVAAFVANLHRSRRLDDTDAAGA